MPEHTIHRCLELSRQARGLEGERLARVLTELHASLESLRVEQRLPAWNSAAAHATTPEPICEPVITMDLAGYLTGWNAGAEYLFGYTAQEAIGRHVLFLYADDDDEIAEMIHERGDTFMQVRRRKKSGEIFQASLLLSLQRDETEQPIGISARVSEIAERLSPEDKLRLHARIIEDSDQGIMIVDADERIVSVNSAFTRITGYAAMEAIGKTPDLLRSGKHDADFRAQVRAAMHGASPWLGEILGRRKNGDIFPQSVSISVVRDERGDITHAFSIFSDISVHKEAEARMQRLANFDSLTGLPNRSQFNQLVGHAMSAARRTNGHGAVLVADLYRIDAIYDTLGQGVGDELFCQVSERFRDSLREADVLARLDGDKFAIALLDIQKREHAGIVAHKLLSALESPITIDAHDLRIGAAIGISVYPGDGLDTASLIRYADAAMMRVAQTRESGFLFYSPEMNKRAQEHLRIESELRRALATGELLCHYQPKVSLRNGRIVGAEALIRWRHPQRGMISPGEFIPIAEETGLIMELGAWVMEETCRQIRHWQDQQLAMPPIAVNLSARQFDRHLPGRIQATLERHAVSSEHLKLEITESLLVRGAENVIPIMNELVALGLSLALDDFGTGYSSLAYLKKFPISTLKIDRSFVIGLPEEANDCAIARAIVTMGQQLRQEIVAEGVETKEQMTFLRELGCDQLQGYLFSAAVPAADFERMVRNGERLVIDR